jgi:hypothetical protein
MLIWKSKFLMTCPSSRNDLSAKTLTEVWDYNQYFRFWNRDNSLQSFSGSQITVDLIVLRAKWWVLALSASEGKSTVANIEMANVMLSLTLCENSHAYISGPKWPKVKWIMFLWGTILSLWRICRLASIKWHTSVEGVFSWLLIGLKGSWWKSR